MKEIFENFIKSLPSQQVDMNDIFLFDGHIWATNGVIAIRKAIDNADFAKKEMPKWGKYAIEYFNKHKDTEHLVPFPKIENPISKKENCSTCYGKGKIEGDEESENCSECEGKGTCTCPDCGVEHDCGYCGGEGQTVDIVYETCLICKGTGKVDVFENVVLKDRKISYKYYSIITNQLSNPKYTLYHAICETEPIFFVDDNGIEGMIMPVNE